MKRAFAVTAAIATLPLAGCGSEEAAPPGPAALVPSAATVYAEAVLRPAGEQREALESSLSLLFDTDDPGALISGELDKAIAESDSELTYEGDIQPWLGERGAVFFTELFPLAGDANASAFGSDGQRGALVLDVTDAEAATEVVAKAAVEEGPPEDASYEGVDYKLDTDGVAAGVVGENLVVGDEESFQAAVDTAASGDSLAGDDEFTAVLAGAAGTSAASLYVDLPGLIDDADAAGALSGSDRKALDTVFAGLADEPIAATLEAEPDGFGLDVTYGKSDLPFAAATEESELLRDLPADAWFAAGFSDIGGGIGAFFDRPDEFGIPGVELEAARRQFQREYGLALEDFYGPLGDGALFASGRGIFGTGGGLLVETESPAAAARIVAALRRGAERAGDDIGPVSGAGPGVEGFSITIPDAPAAINFVASEDRLVIAYGSAVAALLEPSQALGSSDEFAAASEALGEEFAVGFYLDLGPLTELLDLAAVSDPGLQQALPYLEAIDFLIAGAASDGDREHQRFFLGLAESISGPAT